MSKCFFCGKNDDGVICKHCLANGTSKIGSGAKKLVKVAPVVIPLVLKVIIFKKPKI